MGHKTTAYVQTFISLRNAFPSSSNCWFVETISACAVAAVVQYTGCAVAAVVQYTGFCCKLHTDQCYWKRVIILAETCDDFSVTDKNYCPKSFKLLLTKHLANTPIIMHCTQGLQTGQHVTDRAVADEPLIQTSCER